MEGIHAGAVLNEELHPVEEILLQKVVEDYLLWTISLSHAGAGKECEESLAARKASFQGQKG